MLTIVRSKPQHILSPRNEDLSASNDVPTEFLVGVCVHLGEFATIALERLPGSLRPPKVSQNYEVEDP